MKRHPEGRQIGNIFNRNGHWTVKVKVKGRQVWKGGFRTREDAQLYLGKLREDIGRERVGLPKVQRKTLADFAPEYRTWAKAHKRSWLRDDRSLVPLLAAFGHLRLADITKARVEAYMRDRHATPTLASRREPVQGRPRPPRFGLARGCEWRTFGGIATRDITIDSDGYAEFSPWSGDSGGFPGKNALVRA